MIHESNRRNIIEANTIVVLDEKKALNSRFVGKKIEK